MARLTPCPSCHAHVFVDDRRCHQCGAAVRTTMAMAPVVSSVLLGLMLAGCPGDKEDDTGATTQDTHESQDGSGTHGTTAMGTDNGSTTADSVSGSGGVEYGTPDTGIDDATATGTGTGTDGTAGSSSIGEPEYGVPETSTGTGTGTGTGAG